MAHQALDRAVLDAYGWPHESTDDDLLTRLLALNQQRGGGGGGERAMTRKHDLTPIV